MTCGAIFGGKEGAGGLKAERHQHGDDVGGGHEQQEIAQRLGAPEAGDGGLGEEHHAGPGKPGAEKDIGLRKQFGEQALHDAAASALCWRSSRLARSFCSMSRAPNAASPMMNGSR